MSDKRRLPKVTLRARQEPEPDHDCPPGQPPPRASGDAMRWRPGDPTPRFGPDQEGTHDG